MPAELVPHAGIPELAARVTAPQLEVLRQAQKVGFIMNRGDIGRETRGVLDELTRLGLLDVAFEGDAKDHPYLWTSNGNGARVLGYLTGLRAGPHYEISSPELADWLLEQGEEQCWNVDGDPLLTGRMTFPCPAAPLARELRKVNRPLLVRAKKGDAEAKGQPIGKDKLNEVVEHFAENLHVSRDDEMPKWGGDRLLYLCWKGTSNEWLLAEDSETTEQMKAEDTARVTESAEVKRE
jgi:hypothetical protein